MDKIKLLLKSLLITFLFFWITIFTLVAINTNFLNLNVDSDLMVCTLSLMVTIVFCTLLIIEKKDKNK